MTIIQDAKGRRSCVMHQYLPTAWVNIQTDPPRFFLPFDRHLQTITEAPISAHASADGMRRKWFPFRLVLTASQRLCARLVIITPFPPRVWRLYIFHAAPAGMRARSEG
jgi:hypothetical protein